MKKERHEKGPICLVCPMISDRFNMTLIPAAVNILYISFPKPASDAFPNTKPCLQNCSGGSPRTLGAPEIRKHMLITESHTRLCPQALNGCLDIYHKESMQRGISINRPCQGRCKSTKFPHFKVQMEEVPTKKRESSHNTMLFYCTLAI